MGTPADKYKWIGQGGVRWIDNKDYNYLLDKMKKDMTDPAVLVVNGIIFKNGTVQTLEWYRADEGKASDVIPGNYSIKILDEYGNLLTEVWFDARFPVIDGVELDFTGFAFTIPYPEESATIQITHEEEVLTEVTPTTELLHDAIDLIPSYGFVNNAEQRRSALHNKVDAVEKMLKGKNKQGAKNKLENDIKDKLKKWLVIYEKENVLQYSKEEIIELVNDLIRQLN